MPPSILYTFLKLSRIILIANTKIRVGSAIILPLFVTAIKIIYFFFLASFLFLLSLNFVTWFYPRFPSLYLLAFTLLVLFFILFLLPDPSSFCSLQVRNPLDRKKLGNTEASPTWTCRLS